jgi:hypothetical protein
VGNASGENAEGLHLVGLAELLFQPLLLGDVFIDETDAGNTSVEASDGKEAYPSGYFTVLPSSSCAGYLYILDRLASFQDPRGYIFESSCDLLVNDFSNGPTNVLVRGDTVYFCQPLVDPDMSELPVQNGQANGGQIVIGLNFCKLATGNFFTFLELPRSLLYVQF